MRPAALCAIACVLACSRDPEPVPKQRAAEKPVPAATVASPRVKVPLKTPLRERLVAIGDVHGDLDATRIALRLAGAMDEKDHWVGGKMVVVQTGDQLDRGDDERRIVDLLTTLGAEAKAAGGALHVLNGNHETMNVAGDFRYVTPAGFTSFLDFAKDAERPELARFSPIERGRAAAFMPGGPYALKMADRSTILIAGDTVFVHGGVAPEHVRYGVERINREVTQFMRGEIQKLPPFLQRDDSPMWLRAYSDEPLAPAACERLEQVLGELGVRRMVVGHTVQRRGISSACGERVWRIDVGLARHYGGPRQVLEIHEGKVRVLGSPVP
jgi:hypothetical protein